ncbi:Protein of unknown function [Singulisphaera sp. GP187]|uniref:DUF3754 domain-containing protein n=1 Tax=Singulisphaera sp. GP187 TaxID=1882752 RepID=UPI00092811F0|nr:DUF3754 domain-containing protein [Singulisphaera sp. GP187]SIN82789.1 Protein of unknown function [Singulisphaera sp. GP187]
MPTRLPSSDAPSEDDSPALLGEESRTRLIAETVLTPLPEAVEVGEEEESTLEKLVDAAFPPQPEDEDSPDQQPVPLDSEAEADFKSPPEIAYQLPGLDDRERSLPIRQGDLTRLLIAEPDLSDLERQQLAALGAILGATFHSEFYNKLQHLKERYAPLDPDSDYVNLKDHSIQVDPNSDETFLRALEDALTRANYSALDLEMIEQAIRAPNEKGLTYVPDFTLFEHLKVWVRGYTRISRDARSARTRFRKRTVHLDAYQRLVVALKFKPGLKLGPHVRSDVLYLRMFKDVPHVDMEMHLPEQGTKVRMRWIDKAQIASPLVVGLPTLAMKIFAAVGYRLFSLAFLPWGVMGGLMIAPISAGINSFFGFHRARAKHLSAMINRLYYLTLANNASVLTRMIDSAEDEEYKEAMLAYFFLWRSAQAPTPLTLTEAELDARIERYLTLKTGVEINFEVNDALDKLFRLGLAFREPSGALRAVPIENALIALDRQWDQTFRYS